MKKIYILIIILAFISCGTSDKQENENLLTSKDKNVVTVTNTQFKLEKMKLGKLSEQEFSNVINVNGIIDVPPQNKANVSTFLGGFIKKTPLLVGDEVKKGQLLVTIENTEFVELQQQYAEITEQLNFLKSEYNRQKTLYEENITSKKNYLKAESSYKSALAKSNGLRQKLKMMNINPTSVEQGNFTSQINLYAPINGTVSKVNVNNGSYVAPSDEILEIVDRDHLHLELTVFEKDILKIKKGQLVMFQIPEASDKIFKAEVHLVGNTINETNRTVKVHAHLDDEHANLIVGMFAEAKIIINSKISSALPTEAVGSIGNDYYVLVLHNKDANNFTFEKVKLEIGKQNEDYIEVLNSNDLKGKEILVRGAFMLLNEG